MNNLHNDFSGDIQKCLEVLKAGGIILYPTDTIWGLGCDATNNAAVEKLFELKNRPENMAMLVLVNSEPMIQQYVKEVPEIAWQILEVADKPITLIYPNAKNLAPNVIAQDGSIGIRICKDDFCSQLIYKFRKPLVSTSANFSGEKSPKHFFEISKELTTKVDFVVKFRQQDRTQHPPSSIIKLEVGNKFKIIRP
jgi:L-threonylcarbamoyladenylate synthase